jgi:hypothetical protein
VCVNVTFVISCLEERRGLLKKLGGGNTPLRPAPLQPCMVLNTTPQLHVEQYFTCNICFNVTHENLDLERYRGDIGGHGGNDQAYEDLEIVSENTLRALHRNSAELLRHLKYV